MSSHRLTTLLLLLLLTVSAALACGPFFPTQLLDDRAATLRTAPANSFAFEALQLVPLPQDNFQPVEGTDDPLALAKAETEGLSYDQATLLEHMRDAGIDSLDSSDLAGLPRGVALYTAGAVDFNHGQLAPAANRFSAILALPPDEAAARAPWAAFMLGRIHAKSGDFAQAVRDFQGTRTLASKTSNDPLGLAVASFGEEARLYLQQARRDLTGPGKTLPPDKSSDYGKEMIAAIELYAQQAAQRSISGLSSLREVAEELLQPDSQVVDNRLRAVIAHPVVQRLLVVYALAVLEDNLVYFKPKTGAEYHQVFPNDALARLAKAIASLPAASIASPTDRLAVLDYRAGDYQSAGQLANKSASPLASWVKAKLALQRGDLDAAAKDYAEAAPRFPAVGERQPVVRDLDANNEKLLVGETGVLQLARGDYVQALQVLYPVASTYWGDVAYIAERALTTDELKNFVDNQVDDHADSGIANTLAYEPAGNASVPQSGPTPESDEDQRDGGVALRDLLARRLMRDGRYSEAMSYFHGPEAPGFQDSNTREEAAEYASALRQAKTAWWRIDRARGWYKAAVMARTHGMEIMGYEGAPDYYGADGLGQTELGTAFVTAGERARFTATTPPHLRFHYRYIAADEAERAADLVPPRSQAFAAILCTATNWMMYTVRNSRVTSSHPLPAVVRAHQLYRHYLKEGPFVPWAGQFGKCPLSEGQLRRQYPPKLRHSHSFFWVLSKQLRGKDFGCACPEPDFDAAARLPGLLFVRNTRHFVGRHRWKLAVLSVPLLLGVAITIVRFGRARLSGASES